MGGLSVVGADLKPSDKYPEAVQAVFDSQTVIHQKVVELEVALRSGLVDMSWLNRFIAR